jgi:hypothetical protein
MLPFEIDTVVVCDDIRQENNGKWLLIGVYARDIVVANLPADLRLAIWLLVTPKQLGASTIKLRIVVGPHNASLVDAELQYDIKEISPTVFAMAGLPIQVRSEGPMKVEMLPKGATEWVTIKLIQLNVARRRPQIAAH